MPKTVTMKHQNDGGSKNEDEEGECHVCCMWKELAQTRKKQKGWIGCDGPWCQCRGVGQDLQTQIVEPTVHSVHKIP